MFSFFFKITNLSNAHNVADQILNLVCENFAQSYPKIRKMPKANFSKSRDALVEFIRNEPICQHIFQLENNIQSQIINLLANRLTEVIKHYAIKYTGKRRYDKGRKTKTWEVYDIVYSEEMTKWDKTSTSRRKTGTIIQKKREVLFPEKLFMDPLELKKQLEPALISINEILYDTFTIDKKLFFNRLPKDLQVEVKNYSFPRKI